MKAVKIEVISLSESENEAEERYLKIYYPDSTNFIEVPLDDNDGKLLLIDVKVMEPNIFALNLTSEKRGKLYKPKNGCFKEPKEKWSNFKVVAVLKPSDGNEIAKSPISDTSSNINQLLPTNVISTENETVRKKKKVQHFIEDLPSPSIQSPIDSTLNSNEFENERKKKKSKNIIQSSPSPSAQSSMDFENINFVEAVQSGDNAEITDFEMCKAFNVSSIDELKKLLCDENPIFYECFGVNMQLWRKTILKHPNVQIIKALFYAFYSNIFLNFLDPSVTKHCRICDKPFTLRHLVGKWHVYKYQSLYNTDPPEISIVLNPKNFDVFFPSNPSLEMNVKKQKFDVFVNKFCNEISFNNFKAYLIQGITEAQLCIPFEDDSLFEKLLFLRENYKTHPKLNKIFPMMKSCENCRKYFRSLHDFITHILNKQHMTMSLTQEELDKFVYAASFIKCSTEGFYYAEFSTEKRKRNNRHLDESETAISKRHKKF